MLDINLLEVESKKLKEIEKIDNLIKHYTNFIKESKKVIKENKLAEIHQNEIIQEKKSLVKSVLITTLASTGAFTYSFFLNNISFVYLDSDITKLGSLIGLGFNYFRLKKFNFDHIGFNLISTSYSSLIKDVSKAEKTLNQLLYVKEKLVKANIKKAKRGKVVDVNTPAKEAQIKQTVYAAAYSKDSGGKDL